MMKNAWMICVAVVLCAGLAEAQDPNVQSLSGFELPEYDKDGNLVRHIFGDLAEFQPNGDVKITNLRIDFYNNTLVDMKVTAPACILNQKTKEAHSDGAVRMARDNMVVTGVGFDYSNQKQRIKIMHDTKVILKEFRKKADSGVDE